MDGRGPAVEHARPLVLASGSPQRRAILTRMGISFEVVVSGVDESVVTATAAAQVTLELAERKARAVARTRPDALVLGSDTVVDLDGRLHGKPATPDEALATLRALRGRTHAVVTGVVVLNAATGTSRGRAASTAVTMRAVSDAELAAYVASGEPFDKAGAYAIQDGAQAFVTAVDGDLDTVIGLPSGVVTDLLAHFGVPVGTDGTDGSLAGTRDDRPRSRHGSA